MILWNVQVSWHRKLALYAIFGLTVFVMIVSIVRVTLVGPVNASIAKNQDITWLYFWSNIEISVCESFHCNLHRYLTYNLSQPS